MPNQPKNVAELYQFYYAVVKPLYSAVQVDNVLPTETLFELNAAFDHLSRHWYYAEEEAKAVEKAYSHLKRSCLDIFKLQLKETRSQYDHLLKVDTSLLDNGDFDPKMHQLFREIREGAKNARLCEGQTKHDDLGGIAAFENWYPVYEKCIQFENECFGHPKIAWVRKKRVRMSVGHFIVALLLTGLAAIFVEDPVKEGFRYAKDKIMESVHASPVQTTSNSIPPTSINSGATNGLAAGKLSQPVLKH
jgi:hypothetical protein